MYRSSHQGEGDVQDRAGLVGECCDARQVGGCSGVRHMESGRTSASHRGVLSRPRHTTYTAAQEAVAPAVRSHGPDNAAPSKLFRELRIRASVAELPDSPLGSGYRTTRPVASATAIIDGQRMGRISHLARSVRVSLCPILLKPGSSLGHHGGRRFDKRVIPVLSNIECQLCRRDRVHRPGR